MPHFRGMQKLIFILFVSLSGTLFSQTILNVSLVTPEVHIAYRGFHNHLKIQGMEVDSNVVLVSTNDKLQLDRMGKEFIYKTRTPYDTDTLKIYNKQEYITQVVFKIERLGKPRILFGNIRDTLVTKAELLSNPGLICTYDPYLAKMDGIVMEFEVSIVKKNGKEIPVCEKLFSQTEGWSEKRRERYYSKQYPENIRGNQFSKAQLKQISKMKTGEIIWFKAATVRGSDAGQNKIDLDLKLTVVE